MPREIACTRLWAKQGKSAFHKKIKSKYSAIPYYGISQFSSGLLLWQQVVQKNKHREHKAAQKWPNDFTCLWLIFKPGDQNLTFLSHRVNVNQSEYEEIMTRQWQCLFTWRCCKGHDMDTEDIHRCAYSQKGRSHCLNLETQWLLFACGFYFDHSIGCEELCELTDYQQDWHVGMSASLCDE